MSEFTRNIRLAFENRIPRAADRFWERIRVGADLMVKEIRHWSLSRARMGERIRMWRQGFLSESQVLYRPTDARPLSRYVSDCQRYFRSGKINGDCGVILDDKLLFFLVLHRYSDRIAPLFGFIDRGLFMPLTSTEKIREDDVPAALASLGQRLILKPRCGGGGSGVFFYEWNNDAHHVDGREINSAELDRRVAAEAYVVSKAIRQAEYCRGVYPSTTNTIRILTMWDYASRKAFVAQAVHRFGSHSSGAVDNWSQGGLCAAIDLDAGILGAAATFPNGGELVWHSDHPDTGAQIEGLRIPNWSEIRDEITGLANSIPFLPYVGWDIIATDDGFSVIEGNNRPDVNLLQIHSPLLADARVRSFYVHHALIEQ